MYRIVLGGVGCLSIAVVLGCGGGASEPVLSAEAETGRQAYLTLGCASCHGDNLEGKRSAPKLTGIAERWTHEGLVEYLKDPDAVIRSTPRLAYVAEQYPISMPGFGDTADEQTLQAVAHYLLSQ